MEHRRITAPPPDPPSSDGAELALPEAVQPARRVVAEDKAARDADVTSAEGQYGESALT